jgi:transposase-like protein
VQVRQFAAEVILWAVRRYLVFPVSYRDLELRLLDRGVEVDHITIFRWIQADATELEKLIRPHLHMSMAHVQVDETYVTVKGPVDVSVSRHRQPRTDHRLPVVGQARHRGSEAALP